MVLEVFHGQRWNPAVGAVLCLIVPGMPSAGGRGGTRGSDADTPREPHESRLPTAGRCSSLDLSVSVHPYAAFDGWQKRSGDEPGASRAELGPTAMPVGEAGGPWTSRGALRQLLDPCKALCAGCHVRTTGGGEGSASPPYQVPSVCGLSHRSQFFQLPVALARVRSVSNCRATPRAFKAVPPQ